MMVINPWQTLSVCEKPFFLFLFFVLWQKLRAVNGRTCVCFDLISNMKTGPCRNHTKNAKRNTIKKKEKPCVRLVPEKWWWKQILASRWWKGMSTPSSLTELPFRSPDSSSFAKASLTKKKKTMTGGQIPVTPIRNKTEQKEATGSGDSKPQD